MDCKKESNSENCVCAVEDCERRGVCCECMKHHFSKKSLPACMRELDWLQATAS